MTTTARTSSAFQTDHRAPAVEPLRLVHPAAEVVFLTARCPWLWRVLIEAPPSSGNTAPSRRWLRPEGHADQLLLTIGQRRDWHLHVQSGPSPAAGRTPDTTPQPVAREPEMFASVEIAAVAEGRHAWASLAHFATPAGCPLDLAVAYGLSHKPLQIEGDSPSKEGAWCSLQTSHGSLVCSSKPRPLASGGDTAFDAMRLTWTDPVPRVFDLLLVGGRTVGLDATIEQAELLHRLTGTPGQMRIIAAHLCTDAELHYTRPRCCFVEAARYV
ncbi:MAG: hypothetical protein IT442_11640 [Phycisphaeraceae bacterium]|nr:hypothetical protein [Phycisphaeraceae bacterium]